MVYKNFSQWIETKKPFVIRSFNEWEDIFGFDKKIELKPRSPKDINPIDGFDIERIIGILGSHNVGPLEPEIHFVNEVTWGRDSEALRVLINNWQNVIIEKRVTDLTGKHTWVAKKVYQLNHEQCGGKEDSVAAEILEEVERVYKRPKDSAAHALKEFVNIVTTVAQKIQRNADDIFIFQGIRKINENNYIIRLGLRGAGVQRRGQKRVEENHTQIVFDPETGLIRLTNYNIESPLGEHKWAVTQTDLDWHFAPTQSRDEIAETISTVLRWY